jgi:D-alanyl-D-alanine carboxypeptidase
MHHSGLEEIDGETYYFYDWGGMANSFWYLNEQNGGWYFFGGDGAMKRNAWVEWKGEYYYVGSDGRMLTNTTTPDGYRVDANGAWVR